MSDAGTEYRGDSRYKRYETAIERNLATFETIAEWADIIAFLSRLNKTLSSHPQFPVVPKKLVVCKRLAQCLNPNLPSGVHQKTLETYSTIFQKIGLEGLSRDLPLYSFGIFPFFEFASSLVRVEVLEIVSRFYVPLGPKLTECLQSLVLALLPGFEEESGEYFGKCMEVFEKIGQGVSQKNLIEKMWTAMLITHKHRMAVVNYLNKIQPKRLTAADANKFLAENPSLIVTALCAALDDQQALVVRGVLDLVCNHFPLSCTWINHTQKVNLACSVTSVLTRRDMSLSRRIYSWILEDASSTSEIQSLEPSTENIKILVLSIKLMLSQAHLGTLDSLIRPYKVLLFLNDKAPIMRVLFQLVVLDLVDRLQSCFFLKIAGLDKILTAADQLFSVVDLSLVWSSFISTGCQMRGAELESALNLVRFAIEKLPICEDEASYGLLPLFLSLILTRFKSVEISKEELVSLLDIAAVIIPKVACQNESSFKSFQEDSLERIMQDTSSLPTVYMDPNAMLLYSIGVLSDLCAIQFSGKLDLETYLIAANKCIDIFKLFCVTLSPNSSNGLVESEQERLLGLVKVLHNVVAQSSDLESLSATVSLILAIRATVLTFRVDKRKFRDLFLHPVLPSLLSKTWEMQPVDNRSKVAIACLICAIYPLYYGEIDGYLSRKISSGSAGEKAVAVIKVTELWSTAVELPDCPPVFIPNTVTVLLEMLVDPISEISRAASAWFIRSAVHLPRLVEPLLKMLIDVLPIIDEPSMTFVPFYSKPFNADQISYCFKQLNTMVDVGGPSIIDAINRFSFRYSPDLFAGIPPKYRLLDQPQDCPLILAMLVLSLPFSCAECLENANEDVQRKVDSIQTVAQKFAMIVVSHYSSPKMSDLIFVYEVFLDKLQYMIQIYSQKSQPLTVKVLESILTRLHQIRNMEGGGGGVGPDATFLSNIVLQVLKGVNSPEVLSGWTEFLCSSPRYFDDALPRLIEPQCQILIQRIHEELLQLSSEKLTVGEDSFLIAMISSVCDMINVAAGSNIESTKTPLLRSNSAQTLRSSRQESMLKSSWTGIVSRDPVNERSNIDLKLNPVTAVFPFLLTEIGKLFAILTKEDSRLHIRISRFCEKIYLSNPLTVVYLIAEHINSRLEIAAEGTFIVDSPMAILLDPFTGPFRVDILKNINFMFRCVRDARNDPFAKLSIEACFLALSYCGKNCRDETSSLELLNILNQATRDAIGNPTRFRSAIYLLLITYSNLLLGPLCHITPEMRKQIRESIRTIDHGISLAAKSNDLGLWNAWQPEGLSGKALSLDLISSCSKDKPSGKALAAILGVVLPNLEQIIFETDKIQPILSSILGQVILPNLKHTLRPQILGYVAMLGLKQICTQPSLSKYWKKEFWESIFMDQHFFTCNPDLFEAYVIQMKQYLLSEPEKISELLAKIPSSGSSNLFLSREMESLNRALMIRRLSFVIYCVDLDILKMNMPNVQEKIVDILRLGIGISSAEIYFLQRVLLFRLGDEMPSTLWPVIITELVSLYKSLLKLPTPSSITFPVLTTVAQASRLVDLVVVTGSATPLLYFWILFGNGSGNSKDLFQRTIEKFGWTNRQELTSEVERKLRTRESLVPAGSIVDFANLANFFCFTAYRLNIPEAFATPLDLEVMRQGFIRDFIEAVKPSTE